MATPNYRLTKEQEGLQHLELAKDVEMKRALAILKELDPDIDIQWVKAKDPKLPAARRVLQMKG